MVLDFIFYLTRSIQKNLRVMKAYLQECHCKTGDLQTNFTEKPRIYVPGFINRLDQYLLGPIPFLMVQLSENPVTFVSTPENLYFMESANLVVSSYNGLLKIRDRKRWNGSVRF